MLDAACFQLSLRSTCKPAVFVSTATRHLMPRQLIPVIVATTAASPRSTMSWGMTHSCKLIPPCAYSVFAMKAPMPGGEAMRSSGFQYHG